MESSNKEVAMEAVPFARMYKDGTVERLFATEIAPAGFDAPTGVASKDIIISQKTSLYARIYRPTLPSGHPDVPLVLYFHGGAFFISSFADPKYHNSLNSLVSTSKVVLISVNYRKAPENPLPAAYEDSCAALSWVAGMVSGEEVDPWVKEGVDFGRVFLGGDSAGANIIHHLNIQAGPEKSGPVLDSAGANIFQPLNIQVGPGFPCPVLDIAGIFMIMPYFWGEERVGSEGQDPIRSQMVSGWWRFVCTSDKGCDDPLINPFANGSPSLSGLKCKRVIVCVAEKDILKDRGILYYDELVKSEWDGKAEMVVIEGEDHVFHIMDPNGEKAMFLTNSLASFINHQE